MGEPGTKEVLNLADLEAAGGIHTGRKHILTLLVENSPAILVRTPGLFSTRIERMCLRPVRTPADASSSSRVSGSLVPGSPTPQPTISRAAAPAGIIG